MAFEQRSLDDYVDVATRIADFRERYPEGVLQPVLHDGANYRLVQAQGTEKNGEIVQQTFVVVIAAAFRTPDDPRPGIGMAWEIFPGRTNFTRGSELQNAETSAWGRAIIAVGASDSKRGIASREEVRNRQAEREDVTPSCQCGHPKSHHIAETDPPGCNQCDCGLTWNQDGSLSRSRTTDEEKERAGVMTSAQQSEHTALRPKRADLGHEIRRFRPCNCNWCQDRPSGPWMIAPEERDGAHPRNDPAPDPWTDGQPPPSEIGQDTPGTITRQQQSAMHAAFGVLGMTDREERLAYTTKLLGLDQPDSIASSSDLSYRQAGTLLELLEKRQREGTRA